MRTFKDKVTVITGGSNGIGKTLALEYLKAGSYVAVIDLEKPAWCYPEDRMLFMAGDLADEAVIAAFAAKIKARFGQVDYLINNACISRGGLLTGCTYQDFNEVLKVGVTAPYALTQALLDSFTPKGAIVNISSTRAAMSQAGTEAYSAAKGAINALTHALAASLAGRLRVNSISPGWIETDPAATHSEADQLQHPAGRVGTPLDIASMACFLCSEEAAFITGQDFVIDGGMSRLMIYNDDRGWSFESGS